ncbi:MAG: hypothetical protein R6X32_07615 [Chloroflexota bacterium]
MDTLDKNAIAEVLGDYEPPCLSLYQTTHRRHPENQQDPIRFGNLVKKLQQSLLQKYPADEIQPLLEPFLALADDRDFWNHTLDGLAALGTKDLFRVYKLQRPVAELAIVADTFHTKPLLRTLQSADRYQILGLSRHEIKLFEGNRNAVDEIELAPGVPRTITEALGEELSEPHLGVASYGGVTGTQHSGAGGMQPGMHHGHGGKAAEVDGDADRFFRAVDRAILERHSQPSTLPLILAALPEHHHLFHQVSRNPFLLEGGVDSYPDALPLESLRERAWQVVEPHYLSRLTALAEQFSQAMSRNLGHDQLAWVAKTAVAGRVATLLLESGREIPGRIDAATGDLIPADLDHPEIDDALDDLAALTLKMGGEVVIMPPEQMPTQTGLAAIYRY